MNTNINDTYKITLDTVDIAENILANLNDQNDKIKNSKIKINNISKNIDESSKITKRMMKWWKF